MMKPVYFKESNVTLMHGDKGMPVLKDGKQVVSCWKLSFTDRISAIFFGKVWMGIAGNYQYPAWLDCTNSVFIKNKNFIGGGAEDK